MRGAQPFVDAIGNHGFEELARRGGSADRGPHVIEGGEQLSDGGWNCYAPPSRRSSFNSTICVLEGLLEYEKAKGPRAIDRVAGKRDANGRWPLENPHPGQVHFELEAGAGEASRWNTLRALRVLRWANRA